MKCRVNRRDFLATSAAAGAGLVLASRLQADPWKTTLHKAMIGLPTEQILSSWKAAGFEGIEVVKGQKLSPQETAAARKTAESLGMRIHSVLFGWGSLNGGDAALFKFADGAPFVGHITPQTPKLSITMQAGVPALSLSQLTPGARYQLQSSPALASPAWTILTGLLLTNSSYLYLDTASTNASFYRTVGIP